MHRGFHGQISQFGVCARSDFRYHTQIGRVFFQLRADHVRDQLCPAIGQAQHSRGRLVTACLDAQNCQRLAHPLHVGPQNGFGKRSPQAL